MVANSASITLSSLAQDTGSLQHKGCIVCGGSQPLFLFSSINMEIHGAPVMGLGS